MPLVVNSGNGNAFVSRGSRKYVYPTYTANSYYKSGYTVSGTSFGYIDSGELYIVPGQSKISTPAGRFYQGVVKVLIQFPGYAYPREGYIDTGTLTTYDEDYSWTSRQDALHTLKSKSSATGGHVFTLRRAAKCYDGTSLYSTLATGTKVSLSNSQVGASQPRRIYFDVYQPPGTTGWRSKPHWLDLQLEKGALASNRLLY